MSIFQGIKKLTIILYIHVVQLKCLLLGTIYKQLQYLRGKWCSQHLCRAIICFENVRKFRNSPDCFKEILNILEELLVYFLRHFMISCNQPWYPANSQAVPKQTQ